MTEHDKKRLERIRSYCSLSVLLFAGCISFLTYCTTRAKVQEASKPPQQETVTSARP